MLVHNPSVNRAIRLALPKQLPLAWLSLRLCLMQTAACQRKDWAPLGNTCKA